MDSKQSLGDRGRTSPPQKAERAVQVAPHFSNILLRTGRNARAGPTTTEKQDRTPAGGREQAFRDRESNGVQVALRGWSLAPLLGRVSCSSGCAAMKVTCLQESHCSRRRDGQATAGQASRSCTRTKLAKTRGARHRDVHGQLHRWKTSWCVSGLAATPRVSSSV